MAAQPKTTLSFRILILVSPYKSVREHGIRTATRVFPSSCACRWEIAQPIT